MRYRLDLDGLELKDGNGRVVCLMRWRTREGLVLRLPESADVVVPWALVEEAELDLASGAVQILFSERAAKELPWLESRRRLEGEWTDRQELAKAP